MALGTSSTRAAARRLSLRSSVSSSSSMAADEPHTPLLATKEILETDPLSPRLPSMVPNHGKRRASWIGKLLQILPWLVVVAILLWMSSAWYSRAVPFKTDVSYLKPESDGAEMVHEDKLPKEPMAVMVKDKKGNDRWTLSIPAESEFPLLPHVYGGLCAQVSNLTKKMSHQMGGHAGHAGYYQVDKKFIDVAEAEELGLLPSTSFSTSFGSRDDDDDDDDDDQSTADENGYCKKSLTFVMETGDAGFGSTMMLLWMSYGLAKKEGRAFFVDDRHWAYGKYATYFQPPPEQSCLPPPEHHRLPCPHTASHLLISAATQSIHFGHNFNEEYQDPKAVGVMRQKNIFALLRDGYDNLFKLTDEDATYVEKRIKKINEAVRDKGGMEFGVHVRHGDKHPWEFQYQKSYMPLETYVDKARDLVEVAYNGSDDHEAQMASKLILASDDPAVYASSEFSHAIKAQEKIVMASKAHVDAAKGGAQKVDDSFGWEGGFFKDVFWGLGDGSQTATAQAQRLREERLSREGRIQPSEEALQLRAFVGRAYLLDLAIAGQTDRIICTVSSIGCRLLAVMMGWEHAIEHEHWISIDGSFPWVGIKW